MGWLRRLFGMKSRVTESFEELMVKYWRASGDPREQRIIIARAAVAAQQSGNLVQKLEVVGMLNSWEQKYT